MTQEQRERTTRGLVIARLEGIKKWATLIYASDHTFMGAEALTAIDTAILCMEALKQPETERKICGCGGWPDVISPNNSIELYLVQCDRCRMETDCYDTKKEAIAAWNKALG